VKTSLASYGLAGPLEAMIYTGSGNFSIKPFNMATRLYEPLSTTTTLTGFSGFSDQRSNLDYSNGIVKFANGNWMVFWGSSSGCRAKILSGGLSGTWGSDITTLPGGTGQSMAPVVIDPSFTLAHVFTYDSSDYTGLVHYSTIDQTGTVNPDITTLPATVVDSTGVGHPAILNGKLFVPRADFGDFANTVWVSTLPVSSFTPELIPVPSQEQNTFNSVTSIVNGGSGYSSSPGDTFFVDGSVTGCPQVGRVFSTGFGGGTNVLQVIFPNGLVGGGYSPGVHTTTPEGGHPGSGSGLTVNITAPFLKNKPPRTGYMLYPNGYTLAPPTPTRKNNYVSAGGPMVGKGKYASC